MPKAYEVAIAFFELEETDEEAAQKEHTRIIKQAEFLGGFADVDSCDNQNVVVVVPKIEDVKDMISAVHNPVVYNVTIQLVEVA